MKAQPVEAELKQPMHFGPGCSSVMRLGEAERSRHHVWMCIPVPRDFLFNVARVGGTAVPTIPVGRHDGGGIQPECARADRRWVISRRG